jgi:hypothetical protein
MNVFMTKKGTDPFYTCFPLLFVQYQKNIRAKSQDIIIRANMPDLSVNI